jgi:uncharacterized membrane protein YdjX (TVP38/TMEM64 family)
MMRSYLESHIHPGIFIALMLILPIVGAPISVFLVLVGMKFGIVEGILLSAVLMFLHMAITYYLVHSFFRSWITRLLKSYNMIIPDIGNSYNRWHALAFMLIPGLPYAVKNNLLALGGIPFTPYMVINWTAQFGLSIPLIILGGAVIEMNLSILGIAIVLLLASLLLKYSMRKRK